MLPVDVTTRVSWSAVAQKIGPCGGCHGKRVALMGLQDKLFLKPNGGAMSPIARKLAGTSRTSLGTCPTHPIPPQLVSAIPFLSRWMAL
jgi:hypothetical protein